MEEKFIIKSENDAEERIKTAVTLGLLPSAFCFLNGMAKNLFDNIYSAILFSMMPYAFVCVAGLIVYCWLKSYEMVVTDKRVYGKVAWGKRVDLPLDSVSATSINRMFNRVSVATSSGRISFLAVKNSAEIFEKVNTLLVERQKEKTKSVPAQASPAVSAADEIKKFKELLDMGIITQEEFDAKKKELLGL